MAQINRPSMVRLRAGLLVLMALAYLSFVVGRWMATLFSLGILWAAAIGILVALLVALAASRLDRTAYLIIAALVALFGAFTAYDFARGPIDFSQGTATVLALVAGLLLAAAFWDFANLLREFRAWAESRR
ncbi:hypothetical protein KHC28_19600 [Ancylobacter sonchi]|uniref:hypothetical protein n=1 Tax=Ancylobacter sonchi TaxID=1937790 RepID=UPI001BD3AC2B|nr:hypothetical protein [Ancylobacter sonchi]MBS7535861.1 hypothetical protein [Ancylobacter sonchi]